MSGTRYTLNAPRAVGVALALALVLAPRVSAAAQKIWSGASSPNWSDGANWGGAAPVAGDDLVFPGAAANLATLNDLASGAFASITVSGDGYTLAGNTIQLGGFTSTAATTGPTVTLPIALAGPATIAGGGGAVVFAAPGSIDLGGSTLTISGDGKLTIAVPVTGAGSLVRSGGIGITELSGNNTYAGATTVSSGTLRVRSPTALGGTALGTSITGSGALQVMTTGATTFAEPLLIDSTAYAAFADLLGTNTWSGPITLQSDVLIGSVVPFTISGDIGGAHRLRSTGPLTLSGTNSYAGGTEIQSGALTVTGPASLGAGEVVTWLASTLVVGNGTYPNVLSLAGSTFPTGALRTLDGATTWSGPITMTSPDSALDVHGTLVVAGAIGGIGGVTLRGPGRLQITSTSTYEAGTEVASGTLACSGGAAIPDASPVLVDGTLELQTSETIGSLAGSGAVTIAAGTLTTGENGRSTEFQGPITGGGGMTVTGGGNKRLSGTSTYAGATLVHGGALHVVGAITSATTVSTGAALGVARSGSVGTISSVGGTVLPGFQEPRPAASGALSLDGASTFTVELGGTAADDFSHLAVSGGVSLGGAALTVNVGFSPAFGDTFVVIANDGTDAVGGIFAGKAEGSTFVSSGVPFRITYSGGDGNDVALIVTMAVDAGADAGGDAGGDAAVQADAGRRDAAAVDAGRDAAADAAADGPVSSSGEAGGAGCDCHVGAPLEDRALGGLGLIGLLVLRRRRRARR